MVLPLPVVKWWRLPLLVSLRGGSDRIQGEEQEQLP